MKNDSLKWSSILENVREWAPARTFAQETILNSTVNAKGNDTAKGKMCEMRSLYRPMPFYALYFEALDGRIIPSEAIRRFKLNLMGKRLIMTS